MKFVTQLALIIIAVLFSLMAMSAKEIKTGIYYFTATAVTFVLLLVALSVL